jgi:hypothetical protein
MAIPGFPNEAELSSMMGFVTDEDRERWDKMKAASDKQLDEARSGLTARGLASQSAGPAMHFAERAISAKMTGAEMEARRETSRKETKRTVTTFETVEPVKSDGAGLEF